MSMRPILLFGGDTLAAAARTAGSGSGHAVPSGLGHTHPGLSTSSALAGSPYHAYASGLQMAKYPEVAMFSQLGQLFPKSGTQAGGSPAGASGAEPSGNRSTAQRTGSDGKTSYASRHQAAEQRRRTRINDRLDRLRKIVPHAERANTAAFLEEVINYIVILQQRVVQLEGQDTEEAPDASHTAARYQEDARDAVDRTPDVKRGAVPKQTKKRKAADHGEKDPSPAKKVA